MLELFSGALARARIYWFWQSTFVKFCEYFQMEILGVVDYYFGLIKGIEALSGAGWGSPLWACQPTDLLTKVINHCC